MPNGIRFAYSPRNPSKGCRWNVREILRAVITKPRLASLGVQDTIVRALASVHHSPLRVTYSRMIDRVQNLVNREFISRKV